VIVTESITVHHPGYLGVRNHEQSNQLTANDRGAVALGAVVAALGIVTVVSIAVYIRVKKRVGSEARHLRSSLVTDDLTASLLKFEDVDNEEDEELLELPESTRYAIDGHYDTTLVLDSSLPMLSFSSSVHNVYEVDGGSGQILATAHTSSRQLRAKIRPPSVTKSILAPAMDVPF